MAKEQDKIELNDEDRKLIERAAKGSGKPWRKLLRELLSSIPMSKTTQNKSAYDRLLEAGYIGCISDLPSDLSTNKNHMTGFGE